MKRIVVRTLPSGETKNVQPFHITMKGLEKAILCRDNEDYSVLVKYIAVCAHRKNVIVIIYAAVSNHCHVAVLATSYQDAADFAEELKKNYAQWIQIKYSEKHLLKGTDVQAILLDNDWYVRNALAYIPRNALDNGCAVDQYRWSSYRAYFSGSDKPATGLPVSRFTRREQDRIMHTREPLKNVPWLVNADGDILPESFCDVEYLEQVFNNDPAFWLKTIGALNPAEITEKLVDAPRKMQTDSELFKEVADIARRWFASEPGQLTKEKKYRLLPYLWRSRKTSAHQLARVLGLDRDEVKKALKQKDD